MKKIVFGLLSILLLAGCSSNSSKQEGTTIQAIKDKGVLVIGTAADYPPFEFYLAEGGEIVGFDISIAQAIADDLGVKLEIKVLSFDMLIESVKNKQIDMAIAAISPTDKRKKVVAFSDVYFSSESVLLVNKDKIADLDSPEKMKSTIVGAQMGSIQSDLSDTLLADGKVSNVKKMAHINELVQDLQTGSLAGVLMSKQVAEQHIKKNPDLAILNVDLGLQVEEMAIAVPKGSDDFVSHVNGLLSTWKADGSLTKWMDGALALVNK